MEVSTEDVETAIARSIDHAQQSIVSSYHHATSSPRGNLYAEVLLACALANTDELGYFPICKRQRSPQQNNGETL